MDWQAPQPPHRTDSEWPRTRLSALVYLIGVPTKGDGSVYVTNEKRRLAKTTKRYLVYKVELKDKSLGFLVAFNSAYAKVLQRSPIRASGPNRDGHYTVRYCAKPFVLWWRRQSLYTLAEFILMFPEHYLRGRLDSDGDVQKCRTYLVGIEPHRALTEFERGHCRMLRIRTGRIRPYGTPGETFSVGSKKIISDEQRLRFFVNTGDLLEHIGFLNVEWRNSKLTQSRRIRKWTPWPSKLRSEALRLAKEGVGLTTVVTRPGEESGVGVPCTAIYSWLRGGADSWEDYTMKSGE